VNWPVSISWESPQVNAFLSEDGKPAYLVTFDGATNHDRTGYLPVFFRQMELSGPVSHVSVALQDAIYERFPLPDPEIALLDAAIVPDEAIVFHEITYNRKKPYLAVFLLPLRVNAQTGQLEKLISCNIHIDIEYGTGTLLRESRPVHTDQSVLSSGEWYKLSSSQAGIYKISFDDLIDYGLDPSTIDPRNIRIYGNGGVMLEESTSKPRPDDLMENAIWVSGEDDGHFDPQDYILFYAGGPVTWEYNLFYLKFEQQLNLYSDKVFYFLTVDELRGKRIPAEPVAAADPDFVITTLDDFTFHEHDSVNLIKSGKEWYGEVFNTQAEHEFIFHFPDLVMEKPVYFKANFVARATENSTFSIYCNGEYLGDQNIGSVQVGSSIYARTMTTRIIDFMPDDTVLRFRIEYSKPNNTATGWLNYIQLNAKSHLRFKKGQRSFRDVASSGSGNIAQFNLETQAESIRVWDISNPADILEQQVFSVENGLAIKIAHDTLREFIAFDGSEFFSPVFEGEVENQNLHGLTPPNMVILVHPPFLSEAHRLADFHRQYSHLSVNVVTPGQVYNEFSSGRQDVSAIRDFMKMLYDRNTDDNELRYLLLFGDASYDYKDRIPEDNNLVPTFQSYESLKTASSFVTDDFFGCLDDGEGSNASGTVDIGIGRFPVRTQEESRVLVDKVIHYATLSQAVTEKWRNDIYLVADDEDNNIHLKQAEELAVIIDSMAAGFNVNKIFLDSYLQQKSPVGDRYPEASSAIDNAVRQGALIINYTGHGGETGWAYERVLDMPMIMGWDNYDRMPAFVTATCEFSRFDDPALVSAGEWVILNPKGGGIGLFTTTRLAYSQSNSALNKRFYNSAFERDPVTGQYPRMGDLMRHSKTPSSQNIKNFVLLGDPAIMLAYPYQQVNTSIINNEYSGKETDTLKALSLVTISGQVENMEGNVLENFNGKVYPVVYDKPVLYRTRANDNASKVTDFYIQNKALFQGEFTVTGGRFSFSFVVPRDISYQMGVGKISYYAVDTNTYTDAQGYTPVYIGGADELSQGDDTGPLISLYLNDTLFVSGDITTSYPVLMARLYDESGINTVGNGIGHDLTATIDGNTQNPHILNSFFKPDKDTYQSGWVTYPLGKQEPGTHTLSFKAWDIYNNSSQVSITYVIDTLSPLLLKNVLNYPNPFNEGTNFVFTHNKPGSHLEVVIDIFDLYGKFIRSLNYEFTSENLESHPMYWNGKDEGGSSISSGVYIFKVVVMAGKGKTAQATQKMILIH